MYIEDPSRNNEYMTWFRSQRCRRQQGDCNDGQWNQRDVFPYDQAWCKKEDIITLTKKEENERSRTTLGGREIMLQPRSGEARKRGREHVTSIDACGARTKRLHKRTTTCDNVVGTLAQGCHNVIARLAVREHNVIEMLVQRPQVWVCSLGASRRII